ncbi:helix-turn-helix domain-containing protein [Rhodococcus sp. HNM0569]|uniref:TetR/AcrR family transcriptional regulator n=1 Tax=Rhodococcus sp. HNM0569 TaxID=2716340 RepID=UPI003211F105
MSSKTSEEPRKRRSARRNVETLTRLTSAAVAELRVAGHEGLTVRNVAARASVAPATAYTYFSSKEHLVAEVFWRKLEASVVDSRADASPRERVSAVLRSLALLVSDEPELAAACTSALLSTDPDVQGLRLKIGMLINQRLRDALGPGADPGVVATLELVYAGALVQAGLGLSSYEHIADRLEASAALVLR